MSKKTWLLVLTSLGLLWASVDAIPRMLVYQTTNIGVSLFLAWLINMFITGIFAFAGFALPTHKLLPASYYRIRNHALLQQMCTLFQVHIFKKFLLLTFWRGKQQRGRYFNGKREGIANLVEQSMKSEFGHLIPLVLISLLSIYIILNGNLQLGIPCFVINIAGNFYPILLQRQHRMRVQRLAKVL
jgi:hypothetical protein